MVFYCYGFSRKLPGAGKQDTGAQRKSRGHNSLQKRITVTSNVPKGIGRLEGREKQGFLCSPGARDVRVNKFAYNPENVRNCPGTNFSHDIDKWTAV